MEQDINLKIFSVYYKPEDLVLKNEIVQPFFAGFDVEKRYEDFFKKYPDTFMFENFGDNIAKKNLQYGELTAWYWVWKNYLPAHPELTHIGFCHYRRYLNINSSRIKKPYVKFQKGNFVNKFDEIINKDKFVQEISCHRNKIYLPKKEYFKESVLSQYVRYHESESITKVSSILVAFGMEKETISKFMQEQSMYTCLNFIMPVEIFEELCEWLFKILFEFEHKYDIYKNTKYNFIRTPAFIAERLVNLFYMNYQDKIKEVDSYLVVKNYISSSNKIEFCLKYIKYLPRTISRKIRGLPL